MLASASVYHVETHTYIHLTPRGHSGTTDGRSSHYRCRDIAIMCSHLYY